MVNYPNYNTMPTATQPYGYPMSPYIGNGAAAAVAQQSLNTNKIFVSGIEDVRLRPLPPNSAYIFLDNDKSILYQKKVDANGQFVVEAYDITKHEEQEQAQRQGASIDLSGYVPRNEFEALQSEIKALNDKISGITRSADNGTTATTTSGAI